MVLHFHQNSFRLIGNPDGNIPAAIRIFKSIRNDIHQYLLYLIDIDMDIQLVDVGAELIMNLLLLSNTGKVVEDFSDHSYQIYLTQNQFHLVVVNPAKIEYLVDNPVEPVYVPLHQSHIFLNRRIEPGVFNQFVYRPQY